MQTTLVYVNPYIARLAHKSPIMTALVEKLGKNYTVFRMTDITEAPKALVNSSAASVPNFCHGVSFAQLEHVKDDGGTFINMALEGLMFDVELWVDVIDLNSYPDWVAIYMDFSYEQYVQVAGELAIDQASYDLLNLSTQTVVQFLNENKSLTLH